jgi:hypothetical protein
MRIADAPKCSILLAQRVALLIRRCSRSGDTHPQHMLNAE